MSQRILLFLTLLALYLPWTGCGTSVERYRSHGGPILIERYHEPREYPYRLHALSDTGLFVSSGELDRYENGSDTATEFIRYTEIASLSIPAAGTSTKGVLYGLLIGAAASFIPQLAIEAAGKSGTLTGLSFIIFLPIFMPVGAVIGSHRTEYDVYHDIGTSLPLFLRDKLQNISYQTFH